MPPWSQAHRSRVAARASRPFCRYVLLRWWSGCPRGAGAAVLGPDHGVGVRRRQRLDHALQQRSHQVRDGPDTASPSRPAGLTVCGAVIVMTPFESAVRGWLEGPSHGARRPTTETRVGDRATPLARTQLLTALALLRGRRFRMSASRSPRQKRPLRAKSRSTPEAVLHNTAPSMINAKLNIPSCHIIPK